MHSRTINSRKGDQVQYTPQAIDILVGRMTDRDILGRCFYTKNRGAITRVELTPVYFNGDRFRYRMNVPRDERGLSDRLNVPRREVLVITPRDASYQIIVERDVERQRTRVRRQYGDRFVDNRASFRDEDFGRLEAYVRGLLPDDPVVKEPEEATDAF